MTGLVRVTGGSAAFSPLLKLGATTSGTVTADGAELSFQVAAVEKKQCCPGILWL